MKETIGKAILGVVSPSAGIAVSFSDVESWMRVASLVVGIGVGVVSFISIVRPDLLRRWFRRPPDH